MKAQTCFTFSATQPGSDDTIRQWVIYYGDGASASLTGNPAYDYHAYDAYFSQYQITAHAVTDGGTYDATYNVSVTNLPPTVCISGSESIDEGSTYTLGLSAADPGGDGPLTYCIQWGDGASQTLHDSPGSIGHIYADNSSYGYSLQVTVTDAYGASAYASRTVVVNDVPPSLGATGPSTVPEGSSYPLDLCWYDPGADTLTFGINWGDGSQIQTVSGDTGRVYHTFSITSGCCAYVCLTASDEDGTYTFNGEQITVNVGAPAAGYYMISGGGSGQGTSCDGSVQVKSEYAGQYVYGSPEDVVASALEGEVCVTDNGQTLSTRTFPDSGCFAVCPSYDGSGGYSVTVSFADTEYVCPCMGCCCHEVCASNEWTFTMEKLSVSVSATDPNASEAGPDPATFTANISGPISSDSPTLNVCYSMSGTATPTTDYTMSTASFTFTPGGSTSATATLTPLIDALVEGNENANMALNVPATVVAGAMTTAHAVIADDPPAMVGVTAVQSDAAEEGRRPAIFRFTRRKVNGGGFDNAPALDVSYALSGTATPDDAQASQLPPDDYLVLVGGEVVTPQIGLMHVTIPAGEDHVDVTMKPLNDPYNEGDETIVVSVLAEGYPVDPQATQAVATIKDLPIVVTVLGWVKPAKPTSGDIRVQFALICTF